MVVGVLLVFGFALAFVDASLHLGSREEVLVVAQPVAAGQVLTSSDLRTARMSTGSGLDVVLSGDEATVIGRRVAVPLVAGSLLTAGEVGSAPPVGSGLEVVAVGLKAGAYPPELAPGDRVEVVPVTSGSSSSDSSTGSVTSGSPVAATVLSVAAAPADSDTPTVFSLQVSTSDADEVAALAAGGQASLVEVGAGS
ncbi:MAG TPA: SAF domain-containing protein [Acidimicrobiales bacterium]|nr:SAF domain-containing protein [Acidimicrobiales bacterium]